MTYPIFNLSLLPGDHRTDRNADASNRAAVTLLPAQTPNYNKIRAFAAGLL